jgi:diguanylate cyclase
MTNIAAECDDVSGVDSLEEIDLSYASAVADKARALMAQYSIPATPNNFATWFQYSLGTWREFNKTIDIIVSSKRPFDAVVNRSLYAAYLKLSGQSENASAAGRLQTIMQNAKGFLSAAIGENRAHLRALGGVAEAATSTTEPLVIIATLVDELSSAVSRASKLEDKLVNSAQELNEIRFSLYQAEQRAQTDALTGLANRHALDQYLRRAQLQAMETGELMCLLFIDIDHFKQFNDRFGHQIGDHVLRLIAQVLKENTSDDDLTARFGGEEFVAVLPKTELDQACKIAERIRRSIADRPIVRRGTGEFLSKVTVSVGVGQFDAGETMASLFERCDQALYQAKSNGRNQTVSERELESAFAA